MKREYESPEIEITRFDFSSVVVEDNPYIAPGFEEDEALDDNMKFINNNKNKSNGTIGVLSSFRINVSATETPDCTEGESTPKAESYILGDVNRDGRINIKDASYIQGMLIHIFESTDGVNALADVNADNSVDISDATQIQKYCAGLIDSFGSSEQTTEPVTDQTKPSEEATSNTASGESEEDTKNSPPTAPVQSGEWGVSVRNR